MAHSREVRLPFLSHELVEFIFKMPSEFKIKEGWTKFLMRSTFEDLLPKEVAWRKDKIGFEPPQKSWMESKETIQKIKNAREILSKEGILRKGAENEIIQSINSNVKGNGSWNHLMLAKLLEK
jgi:asparagine synthase (glutamine-hydrolysing)